MNRWIDEWIGWMDGRRDRGNNTHKKSKIRGWMNKIIDLNGWGFVI